MDTLEKQVVRDEQHRTRIQVLQHLQSAIRKIQGYEQISLTLEPSENVDYVSIVYANNAKERVNITADSELAMIADVVRKIMY